MTTNLSQPYSFQGASYSRLHGDWRITITDPNIDWSTEWRELAARADDLIRNDSVMHAMLRAKISGTHGNRGLRFRSLYGEDAENDTSTDESGMRREIDDLIHRVSHDHTLDATGMMSRQMLEECLDVTATVKGDAWAVRKYIPNRPRAQLATCWMTVQPYRITNPPGLMNSDTLYEGITMDANGRPDGIWIAPAQRGQLVARAEIKDYTYVPWYSDDGQTNIIHRVGLRPPGAYRGVTMFAPLMSMAKQTKGVIEAYVVAKRIQACHPIFIACDDPTEAAKADRNGAVWGPNTTVEPGKIYYVGRDAQVNFPSWAFNGEDMKDFLDTLYRNQMAAWELPICVVLGQMSSGSNQAARSDWMQYYRTCQRWQDEHINQCTRIIDESIIREGVARGWLPEPENGDYTNYLRGRHVRPPKSMPDPLKEVQAIKGWADLGRSMTGAFAEAGLDLRDEIMQRAEDNKLYEAQGVDLTTDQTGESTSEPGKETNDEPISSGTDQPPLADEAKRTGSTGPATQRPRRARRGNGDTERREALAG